MINIAITLLLSDAVAAEPLSLSAVESPRPLFDVIRATGNAASLPVSFEEPVPSCYGRLEDVGPEVRTDGRSLPVWVPERTSFAVSVDVTLDPADRVKQAVASWASAGDGTEYAVEEAGGIMHVKPTSTWGLDCEIIAYTPLLDTTLHGSPRSGTPLELLGDVLALLSEQTGRKVGLGTVPSNSLGNVERLTVAVEGTRTRDVLIDILGDTYSWYLLYSVKSDSFVLNLGVARPASEPRLLTPRPVADSFNYDD